MAVFTQIIQLFIRAYDLVALACFTNIPTHIIATKICISRNIEEFDASLETTSSRKADTEEDVPDRRGLDSKHKNAGDAMKYCQRTKGTPVTPEQTCKNAGAAKKCLQKKESKRSRSTKKTREKLTKAE
jgi:hypothetical protein